VIRFQEPKEVFLPEIISPSHLPLFILLSPRMQKEGM